MSLLPGRGSPHYRVSRIPAMTPTGLAACCQAGMLAYLDRRQAAGRTANLAWIYRQKMKNTLTIHLFI